MGMTTVMQEYTKQVERLMRRLYFSLSEKDQRHYAAIEAMKIGHGGINYIANLFGCCRQTVATGIDELKKMRLKPPLEFVDLAVEGKQ